MNLLAPKLAFLSALGLPRNVWNKNQKPKSQKSPFHIWKLFGNSNGQRSSSQKQIMNSRSGTNHTCLVLHGAGWFHCVDDIFSGFWVCTLVNKCECHPGIIELQFSLWFSSPKTTIKTKNPPAYRITCWRKLCTCGRRATATMRQILPCRYSKTGRKTFLWLKEIRQKDLLQNISGDVQFLSCWHCAFVVCVKKTSIKKNSFMNKLVILVQTFTGNERKESREAPLPSPFRQAERAILYPCRLVRNGGLKMVVFLPDCASSIFSAQLSIFHTSCAP